MGTLTSTLNTITQLVVQLGHTDFHQAHKEKTPLLGEKTLDRQGTKHTTHMDVKAQTVHTDMTAKAKSCRCDGGASSQTLSSYHQQEVAWSTDQIHCHVYSHRQFSTHLW